MQFMAGLDRNAHLTFHPYTKPMIISTAFICLKIAGISLFLTTNPLQLLCIRTAQWWVYFFSILSASTFFFFKNSFPVFSRIFMILFLWTQCIFHARCLNSFRLQTLTCFHVAFSIFLMRKFQKASWIFMTALFIFDF